MNYITEIIILEKLVYIYTYIYIYIYIYCHPQTDFRCITTLL